MTAGEVGVVVATRNRRAELMRTLDRLRSLPERPAVVVVDNHSGDGTVEAVERRGDVTLIPLDTNIGAAARTVGVHALTTRFAAFSDDDSWWSPGALDIATEIMDRRPAVGLLMGRILVGLEQAEDVICEQLRESSVTNEYGEPVIIGFAACGAIVRRKAFLDVGGFLPQLCIGGEETLLALDLIDAGWQCIYSDDVVVHHHPSMLRDRAVRSRMTVRNQLWTMWLRLPPTQAVRATVRLMRSPFAPRVGGTFDAIVGWPAVRHLRRTVTPATSRLVRAVSRG